MELPDSDEAIVSALDVTFAPLVGRRLALCVSGGADSMALLHLIAVWAQSPRVQAAWNELEHCHQSGAAPESAGGLMPMPPTFEIEPNWLASATTAAPLAWPPVVVLTVDHGLRSGAAEDAAFVKHQSARLGFPHQTLVWSGAKPKTGVQLAAREARYRLLSEVLEAEWWGQRRGGAGPFLAPFESDSTDVPEEAPRRPQPKTKRILVTAHHQEDQAETLLMRLGRGTTLDGLCAMRTLEPFWIPPGRSRSYISGYEVARPLLGVSQASLKRYLSARGLGWCEDPSNDDLAYERVRVRKAFPMLAELGIKPAKIAMAATRLGTARDNIRSRIEIDVSDAVVWQPWGLFARLRSAVLSGKPLDQVLRVLRYVIMAHAGNTATSEYTQLVDVAERLRAWVRIEKLTMGGCVLAPPVRRMNYPSNDLLVWREVGRLAKDDVSLEPGHYVDWDGGRFRVEAQLGAPCPVSVRPLGESAWRDLRLRVPALSPLALPRDAVQALPALWVGTSLVSVPWLNPESLELVPDSAGLDLDDVAGKLDAAFGLSHRLYNARFTGSRWARSKLVLLQGQERVVQALGRRATDGKPDRQKP